MRIQFYDDPIKGPRPREEVRFNQIGVYVHPEGRRIAVGFDITPFLERPSVEVTIVNEQDQPAATLTVIETLQPNFSLTLHLRDEEPTENYALTAVLYYLDLNQQQGERKRSRQVVDTFQKTFNATQEGEQ